MRPPLRPAPSRACSRRAPSLGHRAGISPDVPFDIILGPIFNRTTQRNEAALGARAIRDLLLVHELMAARSGAATSEGP
jgi:hypothetical protein